MILSQRACQTILSTTHHQRMRPVRTSPPLVLPEYLPVNDKAAEFHRRHERIRLLLGGNQSGKSFTTCREVVALCRSHAGTVAWACTKSYELAGSALFPHYQALIHPEEIEQIAWLNYAKRIPALIRWRNGSQIFIKSYAQGRPHFQSARVDLIQLDEQPPFDIYQECLARVSATGGGIIFSMTPFAGSAYVEHDLWDQRGISPYVWAERMSFLENRFVSEERKQAMLALYSKDEIDRRIYGLFVALSGVVFKEFNPAMNVCDPFPIPFTWQKVRAIDLGFSNPFVCLWGALDGEGETLYIYQEHYRKEVLLADHRDIILRMDHEGLTEHPKGAPLIDATVCDHEAQTRAELNNLGINTSPALKDVHVGIERVNRRFKLRGNGRPGLVIFRNCEQTIREVPNYRYKEADDKRNIPEEPIKVHDHTCDALRYLVMHFETDDAGAVWSAGDRVFKTETPTESGELDVYQIFKPRY